MATSTSTAATAADRKAAARGAVRATLPARLVAPRLVLRAYVAADMPQVRALIGDWQVARWLGRVPHPYTAAAAAAWIAVCAENGRTGRALDLLAVRSGDGRAVGGCGLDLETGELGYWLGRPWQGRGYGTEMVGAMLRWAFTGAGLDAVWACTMPGNAPSQRLLERLGFAFTGEREGDFALRGGARPAHHYALPADRWRALWGDAPS